MSEGISPIPCVGRVQLETSTVTPKFTLGVKAFSMQRGKTVTLYIKLPTRGVNLLLKTGSTRTRAIVFVKDGDKKLRRFVAGFLPLRASAALAAKHGRAKTLVVKPETTTTKPKPKPKSAPPPQIIVGP